MGYPAAGGSDDGHQAHPDPTLRLRPAGHQLGLLGCAPPAQPAHPPAAAPAPALRGYPSGGGAGGGGAAAAGGLASLPDLTADLLTGACENGPGKEGADSHFTGSFSWKGDSASGEERWILHANEHWKKKGGNDCAITWRATGSKVAPGACADCDFGLMLTGEPDIAGSDCPEGLVKQDARRLELRYDVKLNSDGTAFIYFAKTGRRLGQGYHTGSSMNWLSQHQCKWF